VSNAELNGSPTERLTFHVPNASVNYYAGILLALLAVRQGAPDFLAALRPLVASVAKDGLAGSEQEKAALVLAGDELYFAAACGPTVEADRARRLLTDPLLLDCVALPPALGTRIELDLSVFNPAVGLSVSTAQEPAIEQSSRSTAWQQATPQPRPVAERI